MHMYGGCSGGSRIQHWVKLYISSNEHGKNYDFYYLTFILLTIATWLPWTYNTHQKSLGHFDKLMKNLFPLYIVIFLYTRTPPPAPKNNVGSFVGYLKLACTRNFPIIACTSPKKQHCFRGKGDESSLQNIKIAKCPRNFGDYCTIERLVARTIIMLKV